ncbi:MAG: hypothetical protein ACKON9_01865, partial [Planctomycetaceae bacterium]
IQEGRPQLDMDMQKSANSELIISRYLPPKKPTTGQAPPVPLIYNFSPTVAFQGDQFVLASTEQLAAELLQAPRQPALAANVSLDLQAEVAGQLVADNQQSLVSQNMLTKGQTREEAEAEVAVLQQLIRLLRGATFQLKHDSTAKQLQLDLAVQLTTDVRNSDAVKVTDRGN